MNANERLREVRRHLGLRQNEVADKLGMSGANISSLEKGKSDITEPTIRLIALTFRVREEWLRDGIGDMFEPEAAPKTADEIKLLNAFRSLTPEMRSVALRKIKEMLAIEQGQWCASTDQKKEPAKKKIL